MKIKFLSLTLTLLLILSTVALAVSCNAKDTNETESEITQSTESPTTESDTSLEINDQTNAEDETDSETEAPSNTNSETEFESETLSEIETPSEKATESETEAQTETESETEAQTETESETEPPVASISVEKVVSHGSGMTVYPGEIITYTFVLTNSGGAAGSIDITDSVPTNTEYVDGAENVDRNKLSWSVTVEAGETKTVSYTVRVNNDISLCEGGKAEPGISKAGEYELTTYPLYIERTLNKVDQQFFDIAVQALKRSEYFTDFNLYRWMYGVAFTYAQAVSGVISIANDTPKSIMSAIADGTANEKVLDMVAPGLYGGTNVTGEIVGIKGSPSGVVTKNDLISGDGILRTKDGVTELFVYSNRGFYCLTGRCTEADLDEVLTSLPISEEYAVLRPSSNLLDFTPSDINEKPVEMSEKQAAVVATAYYYLLLGESAQYDDTFMNKLSDSFSDFNESRWQTTCRTPENYTSDEWGYLNCASFANDVYWCVLGRTLPGEMYTTKNLYENSASKGMRVYNFAPDPSKTYTDEEKANIETEFMSNLQPGDLIVIRRKNGGGHVVVYIGNGRFIHSTGGSISHSGLDGAVESREPTIRFQKVKDYLFSYEGAVQSSYLFTDPSSSRSVVGLAIVRPFASSGAAKLPISEATKARMKIIGLVGEKTASVNPGISVNAGDEITYTFTLDNTRTDDITVEITDKIPANTTYISGCDNRDGDNLYWKVTIPAGKTVTVSYTVKVNEDALGSVIQSKDATIEGLIFKCSDIYVRNTLTEAQKTNVIDTFYKLKAESTPLRGLALVNEIYKIAIGLEKVFTDTEFFTVTEGKNGIYAPSNLPIQSNYTYENFTRNEDGAYYKMLVPTMFGGRSIRSNGRNEWLRTRGVMVKNLMVGDIILGKRRDGNTYIFMYTGDNYLINLSTLNKDSVDAQTTLDRLLGYDYFAVVRPSFSIE